MTPKGGRCVVIWRESRQRGKTRREEVGRVERNEGGDSRPVPHTGTVGHPRETGEYRADHALSGTKTSRCKIFMVVCKCPGLHWSPMTHVEASFGARGRRQSTRVSGQAL
jgi:hypothetical protein